MTEKKYDYASERERDRERERERERDEMKCRKSSEDQEVIAKGLNSF